VIRAFVLAVLGLAGCAQAPATAEPPSFVPPPPDWVEHAVGPSAVSLHLPPGWMTFDEGELSDREVRAKLEDRFPGARGLFRAVEAQGSRVELAFLGIDPSSRGGPDMPATVAVVAVEPRVPAIGLDLGADLVLDGLGHALEIETDVERERVGTPVGDAVRFSFEHRIADDAGAGIRASLDGALVTTDGSSFLVLRNVDAGVDDPLVPSLEEVVGTLGEQP
jgi:hypothetical protein